MPAARSCRARRECHGCRGTCASPLSATVVCWFRRVSRTPSLDRDHRQSGRRLVGPGRGTTGTVLRAGSVRSMDQARQRPEPTLVQTWDMSLEQHPGVPFARSEGRSVFGAVAASYQDAPPDYPDRRVRDPASNGAGSGPRAAHWRSVQGRERRLDGCWNWGHTWSPSSRVHRSPRN